MVKVGDIVYVGSSFFLSHGEDDFVGGKAHVATVYKEISGGKLTTFITVKEDPDCGRNWGQCLSREQKTLAKQFGDTWAHADPDTRPEFNRWD